jgi:solute carrier family 25 (adenine nucleotide translocator) protein 4/5/6/31
MFISKEDLKSPLNHLFRDLLAGGTAGAIAKTLSAPLERVKLLLQTQKLNPSLIKYPYESSTHCFRRIYQEEGLLAFWRGNMASIYRYYPNIAMSLAFKDLYKRLFIPNLPCNMVEKKVIICYLQ